MTGVSNKSSAQNKSIKILWKVNRLNPGIASVRIRTLIPGLELERSGHVVSIGDHSPSYSEIENSDVIIINKSFTDIDIKIADKAKNLKKILIVDLCDNIFIENYGKDNKKIVNNFRVLANHADCIVTTNEKLKEKIINNLETKVKIVTIPDAYDENKIIEKIFGTLISIVIIGDLKGYRGKYIHLSSLLNAVNKKFLICLSRLYYCLNSIFYRLAVTVGLSGKGRFHQNRKVVIWFGNAGENWGRWGMVCIKDIVHHLEKVNSKLPLQLLVLSKNRDLFKETTKNASFPCIFREWNTLYAEKIIGSSDVCILPSSRDEFSYTKSANRAVLALSLGVPVVADLVPSLKPIREVISLDNWTDGLFEYLSRPDIGEEHVALGKKIISDNYSPNIIGKKWSKLISDLLNR